MNTIMNIIHNHTHQKICRQLKIHLNLHAKVISQMQSEGAKINRRRQTAPHVNNTLSKER